MSFDHTLKSLRLARGLTQQALAEQAKLKALQIRRYEAGKSQPMLDAIQALALALGCSTDELIFGEQPRGAQQKALRYQMEAIEALPKKSQTAITNVLDALIKWHQNQQR